MGGGVGSGERDIAGARAWERAGGGLGLWRFEVAAGVDLGGMAGGGG